jgi:transposase
MLNGLRRGYNMVFCGPSYVPREIIRDLRDQTRMRASLSEEASRISSRIQKVLEDAKRRLASVATNALGKSGRAMLEDIIAGEDDPEHLASLAPEHQARCKFLRHRGSSQ